MTTSNDVCDFHGHYVDPMGCTTRHFDGDILWCGQCEAGRIFMFRKLSNAELRAKLSLAEESMEASGLSHEDRGSDPTAWWQFLEWDSLTFHAAKELDRRSGDPWSYPEESGVPAAD